MSVAGRSSDLLLFRCIPSHSSKRTVVSITTNFKSLQHRVVLLNFTVFPFHLLFFDKKFRTPITSANIRKNLINEGKLIEGMQNVFFSFLIPFEDEVIAAGAD